MCTVLRLYFINLTLLNFVTLTLIPLQTLCEANSLLQTGDIKRDKCHPRGGRQMSGKGL